MIKCMLLEEINQCKFCDLSNMTCNNPNSSCAFRDDKTESTSKEYVREERWYEKYYKK